MRASGAVAPGARATKGSVRDRCPPQRALLRNNALQSIWAGGHFPKKPSCEGAARRWGRTEARVIGTGSRELGDGVRHAGCHLCSMSSGRSSDSRVERLWADITRKLAQRRARVLEAAAPEPLARIRRLRRVSQAVLALRIGIHQGDLSRLERRPDLLVSTLRRYLAALGGSLELWARFPDSLVRVELTAETTSENSDQAG